MIFYTYLKSIFAKAFSNSSSNPALPVDGVAGQQEEPHEDVGIEVPVGIRETENGEEIHVDDQADADDQATVDDPIASKGKGMGWLK